MNVIHLRPKIDGCHQYNGLLWPKTMNDFRRLRTSSLKCDLNQTDIRIVLNNFTPFCDMIENGTELQMTTSVEKYIIDTLSSKLNFHPKLIDAKQNWGKYVNGTWTGSVAYLINETSDLAMGSISVLHERIRFIEYSDIYIIEEVGFISRIPKLMTRDWIVIEPFTWTVWFMIIISFLIISIILYIISNHIFRASGENLPFRLIWSKLFAIVVNQQAHVLRTRMNKNRLIFICWIFGNMVLSILYSTQFYRFLALHQYDRPLRTNFDLIDAIEIGTHDTITLEQSIVLEYGVNDSDIFYVIGQNIQKNSKQNVPKLESGFDKLEQNSRYVLIESKTAFKYLIKNYAQKAMLMSEDNMAMDFLAIGFSKHSPLYPSFNRLIKIFTQNGFIQHWIDEVIKKTKTANPAEYSTSMMGAPKTTIDTDGLDINDIKSILIIWSIGLSSSTIILLNEIIAKIIYLTKKKKMKMKMKKNHQMKFPKKNKVMNNNANSLATNN
ncbi:glutamate receptor-like [Dermatophagoides farinae]|uniref:glutamate receptor-like n=1 Tax=Dermatophagoides farinae TaxID=6954 RepID=UPI003F640F2F